MGVPTKSGNRVDTVKAKGQFQHMERMAWPPVMG